MAYTKVFEKEYENGWMPFPSEETMVTAHALNEYDDTLEHIEDYLFNYDANDNIAEEYSDSSTYNQGDYAIYYGMLYKAIVDIDTSESFDPDHWTRVLVTDEIGQGGGGTTVVPNPVGEPTDDLETIQIGGTIYDIPGGGGGNANIWTGTQAEYEAQASQIADDTVVLITDDEEHTQAFDIYSTDEQVIGTWFNKPLYRKVITVSGFSSSLVLSGNIYHGAITVSDYISNVDKIFGIADKSFIEVDTNSYRGFISILSEDDIQLDCYTAYNRSGTAIITVEYTKTTD